MTSEGTEIPGSTEPRPAPMWLAPSGGDDPGGHRDRLLRYYVHNLRVKMYADAVQRLEMTEDEARMHYRLAMQNFDELMSASFPAWRESIEAEMTEGMKFHG